MQPKGVFAIQGFYFQEQSWLAVAFRSVEGAVPVIQSGTIQTFFSGVIYPRKPKVHESQCGFMQDAAGHSSLHLVHLTANRLYFVKSYIYRDDSIEYTFGKKDGYWDGKYYGDAVGEGFARCTLTELPPALFRP